MLPRATCALPFAGVFQKIGMPTLAGYFTHSINMLLLKSIVIFFPLCFQVTYQSEFSKTQYTLNPLGKERSCYEDLPNFQHPLSYQSQESQIQRAPHNRTFSYAKCPPCFSIFTPYKEKRPWMGFSVQ